MGNKTSHARLVQRKTGAGYQVSLLKVRAVQERGPGELQGDLSKLRALPDSPVTERKHTRCVHCLEQISVCVCNKKDGSR